MDTFLIKTNNINLSEEEFFHLCAQNRELRFERDKNQNIIVMSPTGIETSFYNSEIILQLGIWNKQQKSGIVFESNAGFTLPNGAVRSPDTSWLSNERYHELSEEDKKRFAHTCPEFVIELKSPTDALHSLKEKMHEWIENGAQLAWLINPETKNVIIYRKDGSIAEQDFTKPVSGEDVLPGFELDLGFVK